MPSTFINSNMEDLTLEIRTLIHHILHRHKIYRMEAHQLQEILQLLKQTPTKQSHQIQQKIFRGIVQFNLVYKDNISQALSQQSCNGVSIQTKSTMHKVLHQFYFLNSIKAYQMFLPHFQQPALHSAQNNTSSPQLFDDQFERMRLHYQYYGPLSVYNCGQMPPPQLNGYPSMISNPPSELQYKQAKSVNTEKKPLSNSQNAKNLSQEDLDHPNKSQSLKPKHSGRGRPPKNRQIEEMNHPIINQTQNIPNKSNQLQNQKEIKPIAIQSCICRGIEIHANIQQCGCGRLFHPQCNGNSKECIICMQIRQDPFKKVISIIGQCTLNFNAQDIFENTITLSQHWQKCRSNGFDIMISCASPKFSGICWPDDIIICIQGRPILQIPALLKEHYPSHRNDTSLIITPYINYFHQNGFSLDSLSFRLNTISPKDFEGPRRNNKDSLFSFCFLMIQQLTPQTIFSSIQKANRNNSIITPFQWPEDPDVQIDRLTITLIDTYSQEVIQCPARGIQCQHLQCFDLKNFLNLTYLSSFRQWKCPFCRADVRNLIIDQYQLRLLNQLRNNIPKTITFSRNGRVDYHDWFNQPSMQEKQAN